MNLFILICSILNYRDPTSIMHSYWSGGEHSLKVSAPQLSRFGIDSVLKIPVPVVSRNFQPFHCKHLGGPTPLYIVHVAAFFFCVVSPLDIQNKNSKTRTQKGDWWSWRIIQILAMAKPFFFVIWAGKDCVLSLSKTKGISYWRCSQFVLSEFLPFGAKY